MVIDIVLAIATFVLWLTQAQAFQVEITPNPVILGQPGTFSFHPDPGDFQSISWALTRDSNPSLTITSSASGNLVSITKTLPNEKAYVGNWTLHVYPAGSMQAVYNFQFQAVDPDDEAETTSESNTTSTSSIEGAIPQSSDAPLASTSRDSTTRLHLNTKIIAGIVAGSVVFLICLTLAFILQLKRRRRRLSMVYLDPPTEERVTSTRYPFIDPFLVRSSNSNGTTKRLKESLPRVVLQGGNTTGLGTSSATSSDLFISDGQGRILPIKEADRVLMEFGVVVGVTTLERNDVPRPPPSYTPG